MFFNKKSKNDFVSPAKGEIIELSNVNDQVFSQKMMGDGFAIRPDGMEVVAPFDGELVIDFPSSKHAYGIKNDKMEILIHIGVDTVNLKGEGFEAFAKKGDTVKKGDLLAKVDFKAIESKVPSTDIIVIFTDGKQVNIKKMGNVELLEENIIEAK